MITHMSGQDYLVQDLYAGSDRALSFNIRVVTELAWHSLFIRHLLRRPERSDLDDYLAKCTLINCPSFRCNPARHCCRYSNVIAINFEKKLILIAGTE